MERARLVCSTKSSKRGEVDLDKKVCSVCKKEQDVEEFHKNKAQPSGRMHICRTCRIAYETSNWAGRLYRSAKNRKVDCDISKEYILELFKQQKGYCYWYNVKMIPSERSKDPQQPSLDRLDPEKGYVKGNVVLTCLAANLGRNRTNIERFKDFVDELRKNYNDIDE